MSTIDIDDTPFVCPSILRVNSCNLSIDIDENPIVSPSTLQVNSHNSTCSSPSSSSSETYQATCVGTPLWWRGDWLGGCASPMYTYHRYEMLVTLY